MDLFPQGARGVLPGIPPLTQVGREGREGAILRGREWGASSAKAAARRNMATVARAIPSCLAIWWAETP